MDDVTALAQRIDPDATLFKIQVCVALLRFLPHCNMRVSVSPVTVLAHGGKHAACSIIPPCIAILKPCFLTQRLLVSGPTKKEVPPFRILCRARACMHLERDAYV